MADAGLYLYEFLYRGRAPDSAEAPAYHVILAQDATDAFGNRATATSAALTPEQAETFGFDLPAIVTAIDAATLAEAARLRAQVSDLQAQVTTLQAALAAAGAADAPTSAAEPAAPNVPG